MGFHPKNNSRVGLVKLMAEIYGEDLQQKYMILTWFISKVPA
jgi:hypothetical protein